MKEEPSSPREPGRFARIALGWSGVVSFALLWELSGRLGWVDRAFVPPLTEVVGTIGQMTSNGTMISHVLVSTFRAVLGFVFAIAIGLPLGILLGYRAPLAYAIVEPLLRVLSQVNPFSLMPVFLLFFGSGEMVKLAAVAWVALWPIVFYTVTAMSTIDTSLLKTARAMAAAPATLLWRVALPAAIPTVFVGIRIASSLVFFVLVGAEMLGTTGGLGWLVHNSAMNYQIRGIYAGALLVILLGYGLHTGLVAIETRLFAREGPLFDAFARDRRPILKPLRPIHALSLGLALLTIVALGGIEVWRLRAHDRTGTVGSRSYEAPSTAAGW